MPPLSDNRDSGRPSRRAALSTLLAAPLTGAEEPLRLGVVGLVHGHVRGFLKPALARKDVRVVAIAEPDAAVAGRYTEQFGLDRAVLFSRTDEMLEKAKPEAVVVYTNTFDHRRAVEACAARGIHVMMEKPLAVSMEHGQAMAAAARQGRVHVLVNYETTWYPNNQIVWSEVKERRSLGRIRKVVVRDGHNGPKEIGVQPEFLDWLTDPARNGAGALYDFGCYGANLMTWLMDGQRPLNVSAVVQRFKPSIYSRVDDDATVILDYGHAQATLQPSWNWPVSRKDMDIYGESGYLQTVKGEAVRIRRQQGAEEQISAPAVAPPYNEPLNYFAAVIRGRIKPDGLSALDNNLIVTEILAAARESAASGRRVELPQKRLA